MSQLLQWKCCYCCLQNARIPVSYAFPSNIVTIVLFSLFRVHSPNMFGCPASEKWRYTHMDKCSYSLRFSRVQYKVSRASVPYLHVTSMWSLNIDKVNYILIRVISTIFIFDQSECWILYIIIIIRVLLHMCKQAHFIFTGGTNPINLKKQKIFHFIDKLCCTTWQLPQVWGKMFTLLISFWKCSSL